MIVHLIDISPHIYAGYVNKRAIIEGPVVKINGEYISLEIPSGGISFLFNKIRDIPTNDTIIFVGDRYPKHKVLINANYKKNRNSNDEIEYQKELAEIILKDCGYVVLAEQDYEADDIIFTICNELKSKVEKICVHVGDSDMYVCVDKNVEILPACSRDKHVTYDNYEYTVKKNRIIPYNMMPILKILEGSTSNNITKINSTVNDIIWQKTSTLFAKVQGNKDVMRRFFANNYPSYLENFDLNYPLIVPDLKYDITSKPDIMRTKIWGSKVGNIAFKYTGAIPDDIQKTIDSFFETKFREEI